MTIESAIKLLAALRCPNITPRENGWVRASCPLARWKHQSHQDANPSFALIARPGEVPTYNCYACGTGTAVQLIAEMELYAKADSVMYDFPLAHAMLEDQPMETAALKPFGLVDEQQEFEEWGQWWLDSFVPAEFSAAAANYLASREVSMETCKRQGLRYDSKRQMIVCPYWSVGGKLAGARGRSILPGTSGIEKHYDYRANGRNNAGLCWYNEHALNLPGPVVIVEGQFDCMRVEEVWPKTVANLTAQPRPPKMRKIGTAADTVVLIPDNDKTGELSVPKYQQAAKELGFLLRVIHLPDSVKDPAECHPQWLLTQISAVLQKATLAM